ncbi:SCO family protein [Nocardioides sp. cx-173]|uniref:SCO family protein n=1 Tax=Nocardioides sp. cx-173 TaxID=2898796 RepID=UPI001E525F1F|nr:SCO family protein [Nocardioides sp. cx-173]MCD4526380.1 SCO family protein [Nocardioides sp. cx-173]UGB43553.1 SCO family protein [Nocardioides sp. cx-173]
MRRLLLPLVALVLVLSGCSDDEPPAFSGTTLERPYQAPDVALTDTDGQPYSLAADTDKRLTLVFFGYSHCPDICQQVMGALAGAMNRLDAEDREQVDVVFVTTDPARDTPAALRSYLDRLDPSFIGLTGDIESIVEAGKPLAVYVSNGKELPSGGYDLGGHSTQVIGLDSDDEAPVYWDQETSQAEFAADIHTLLAKED